MSVKHLQTGFTEALLADRLALFAKVQRDLLPEDQAADWHRLA